MNLMIVTDFLNVVAGMNEKAWYLSKTQWMNMISLVVLVGVNFGWISVGLTPDEVNMLAVAVIPVINMLLRAFYTRVPLTKNVLPDGKVAAGINELEIKRMVENSV